MTARYRPCGTVLLRSTTDPGGLGIPHDLDLHDPDAIQDQGLAWLARAWDRWEIREAITVASPALATRVSQFLEPGTSPATKDLRRAIISVASYLLRWQRRVTPFGLFAGVMPATTGPASAAIETGYRTVARADADWIAVLAGDLDRDPCLRPRLTVIASNLAVVRDGRLTVSSRADPGSTMPGPVREASVRRTRPVQAAIELAATPIEVATLTDKLASQFPAAAPEAISAILDGLIGEGFLITSLHPPMTAPDPLAHLITALRDGGEQVPGRLLGELEQISRLIAIHNQGTGPASASPLRAEITARMTALAPCKRHPLQVDVRLDGHVTIPQVVVREAAAAAEVLIRLTTRPFGSPGWTDYHQRFRRRYGPGALVPVKELVSDAGLGYPDGFLGAPRQRPAWRMLTDRDAVFLGLVQQAALTGATEISLTEQDVQELTAGDHRDIVPPQRIEVGVSLHASSTDAINNGDFELRLTAAPRTPTSMAGRFSYLLSDAERDRADPEPGNDGTLTVQVSFPPRVPHNENVTRVPPLGPAVLPLGEHPGTPGTISVDDLAVTADAAQMYLIHRPTGRRVIPQIPHALDVKARTPPLARFIAEVADARTAYFGPLDPGAAHAMPYIPRIRYRRTTLAATRWLLPAADVLTPIQNDPGPKSRLTSWLRRWNVPHHVVMCADELRLPLDLGSPLDRALLLASLERAGTAELREDAPPEGSGWLSGRPAELLIPLTLTTPAPRTVPVTAPPGRTHRPGSSPVICARITGNPARFVDIIGYLPELMTRLDALIGRWWLRRHRDMIQPSSPQHVAVLIRLRNPADFAAVAAELADFAAGLEARALPADLALLSYTEHPGRYGHGEAMTAAEDVFAADTTAAIAQIAMTAMAGISGQALAAASMATIAAAFAPIPEAGYRALTKCLEQGSGPLDRTTRDEACRLADPSGSFRAVRALPGGDAVAASWDRRDTALAAYHEALSAQRDPGTVLRTLLHEHQMRALGLDPDYERQTGRHARAAALQRLALEGRM